MAEAEDPAPDVTDLATAKRYIAGLRASLARMEKDAEPADNEITVFLSDEDAAIVKRLYERGKLCYAQAADPGMEFFETFQEFVSEWIAVANDMADDELAGDEPEMLSPKMA